MIEATEITIGSGIPIRRKSSHVLKKVAVYINREDGSRIIGTFIEKTYRTEEMAKEVEALYAVLNRAFRQAKKEGKPDYFPLPETFRRIGRKIIMTNLAGVDRLIYDKHTPNFEISVKLSNPEECEKQAFLLMDIARDAGIYTSPDTHGLVVNSYTGRGRAVMFDLDLHCGFLTAENEAGFRFCYPEFQAEIIRQIEGFAGPIF